MASSHDRRRRRRPPVAPRPPRPADATSDGAWRVRVLQAELRGIEAGLITASRGPASGV